MKGFIKACLIAVLIFLVAGIVLIAVAAAGGVTRASMRLFCQQDQLRYGPFRLQIGNHFWDGFSVTFWDDGVEEDAGEYSFITESYQVEGTSFSTLQLDQDAGDFTICPSQTGEFYLESDWDDMLVEEKDGTLSISSKAEGSYGLAFLTDTETTLYVPQDAEFQQIAITVAAGDLEIDEQLSADLIRIEVGAGEVSIDAPLTAGQIIVDVNTGTLSGDDRINAREHLKLTAGMGSIELSDVFCENTLYASCAVGNLEVQGRVQGDIDASVDVGNMELELTGNGGDYNYEVDAGPGNVSINDFDYSGLKQIMKLQGDPSAQNIKLKNGVGNLELQMW